MKNTLMVLAVVAGMMCSSLVNAPVVEETIKVRAQAGDTIWSIAEAQYAKGETRCMEEFVDAIRNENDLTGNKMLQAGQMLTIRIHKRK